MANKSLGSWTVGIGVSDVQFKDGLAKIEVQATGFAKRIKGSFSPLTGVFNDLKGMIIGAFSVAAITGAVKYFDGIDASVRKMTVGISNARKGTADFGGIAKDIYTSMPLSIDQATAAVTLLANKTKLTGDAFKEAAKQAGGLAVLTGGNGATSSSLMAMKKWGVNQGDFKQYTDFMYSLTKESGLGAEGIEQLNQELIQTDNTLGKFGFSMGGAAEFLASMTAEGIDTQQVIGSLDKSVKQMVADRKYGVDNLADGWQKMREEIEKAQTPMEKLAIAQQYFGAKGGASEMLDVFEKVKISLDGSSVSMSSVLGDVKDMKTPMEELSEAMKKVEIGRAHV